MSQLSIVFQYLCVTGEPEDFGLFSGLQLFSSRQLFPIAQDNAESLHKSLEILL